MSHKLRPYQNALVVEVLSAWQTVSNVLAVAPTGAGKTVIVAHVINLEPGASVFIAHRTELIAQASVALAREGIRHRVIGPAALGRACAQIHLEELGRDFTDPGARCAVAGVNSLVNCKDLNWLYSVRLAVVDEGHHLLKENIWGRAIAMFPNARVLAVTATPLRADGKGLGRHHDGLIDKMVLGPPMRELINRKFLTDYRIFAAPSNIDLSAVALSAGGDFSPEPLRKAVHKSRIVGDVVKTYLKVAPGKSGMTFCVDIEGATEVADAFRAAGVSAEVITGKTPDALRSQIMRKFRAGQIKQLVSVDIMGEGTDVPAVEVISFARPTASYGLFVQQFGRALRLMDGKLRAIIIDHVGNVARHGLPDAPRPWSLNRRERAAKSAPSDAIPTRTCLNETSPGEICANVYERVLECCPECGHVPVPASRSGPEQVDGDLTELSPEVLAKMRGEIDRVMGPPLIPGGMPTAAQYGLAKTWNERLKVQEKLRHAIALWGGWQQHQGRDTREAMKRFFFRFGLDTGTAATLGSPEALALLDKVQVDLDENNIIDGSVT